MAPIGESVFFPALDRCLSNTQVLISWKAAFNALLDGSLESATLERYLSDEGTVEILSKPYEPDNPPTAKTRSSFETRTAAIHVTPSDNGRYDIEEIKKDALWLSRELNVDEVATLRIVVLEWQCRPAALLLGAFQEEELLSVTSAIDGGLGASIMLGRSLNHSSSHPTEAAISEEQRRRRLCLLYLEEREHMLKVSATLASIGAAAEHGSLVSGRSPDKGKRKASSQWTEELARIVLRKQHLGESTEELPDELLIRCTAALHSATDELGTPQDVLQGLGLEGPWIASKLTEMIYIMYLMLTHLQRSKIPTTSLAIERWFEFVGKFGFFQQLELPPSIQEDLLSPLQTLVGLVSLAVVALPQVLEILRAESSERKPHQGTSKRSSYYQSVATMKDVTQILASAADNSILLASPAMLAWSVILLTIKEGSEWIGERSEYMIGETDFSTSRRGSLSQPPNAMYDEISKAVVDFLPKDHQDIAESIAATAVDTLKVFDVTSALCQSLRNAFGGAISTHFQSSARTLVLGLLRESLQIVKYGPEVVEAILICLEDPAQVMRKEVNTSHSTGPVENFLRDVDILMPQLFVEAQMRYPYEMLPYLQLCQRLSGTDTADEEGSPIIRRLLQSAPSITTVLPLDFHGYELTREDEAANCYQLTEPLPLISLQPSSFSHPSSGHNGSALILAAAVDAMDHLTIPAGTLGYVVNDTPPRIVTWEHQHSAISYFSQILAAAAGRSSFTDQTGRKATDEETVPEIIGTLAVLLRACVRAANASSRRIDRAAAATELLEEASDGLDRTQDIITIIFNIFEHELLAPQQDERLSNTVLVNCMRFMRCLMDVLPGRVWPLMARSQLLGIGGSGARLINFVASREMTTGCYDFLAENLQLFMALVDDAISNAIRRRTVTKAVARFDSVANSNAAVPGRLLKDVLLAYTRTFVDVFESSPRWKFVDDVQRKEINTQVAAVFHSIIRYTYGYGSSDNASEQLAAGFQPSADYLLEAFLSTLPGNDIPTLPFIAVILAGSVPSNSKVHLKELQARKRQTETVLDFATLLLKTGRYLSRPRPYLEDQLFKASPALVRLYAMDEAYKAPVLGLLETLVKNAEQAQGEPPSLLGYLGATSAQHFLDVLSLADKPLSLKYNEIQLWRFLAAVVGSRQQWLASFLITGNAPRKFLIKDTEKERRSSKSLLTIALDELSGLASLQKDRAGAILEFVACAQNSWAWATNSLRSHPTFLSCVLDFIGNLKLTDDYSGLDTTISRAQDLHMASLIAEILAAYLHCCREMGDTDFVQTVLPKLKFLTDTAVAVPSYNVSLHRNLKRNFESKFPACSLLYFKRTRLLRAHYGKNYYHDGDLATKTLDFDQSWEGGKSSSGFAEEFVRANVNLSLVEAQIRLLEGWRCLVVEISNVAEGNDALQKLMSRVVIKCLKANMSSNLQEAIFDRLLDARVDLAFMLMQKLVAIKSLAPELKPAMNAAWDTIRTCGIDFELAFVGPKTDYYRSLLKILLLALQTQALDSSLKKSFHPVYDASNPSKSVQSHRSFPYDAPTILEILNSVVAKGFRGLCGALHESPTSVQPADFALLTGILQSILRLPGIGAFHHQISLLFQGETTVRYATALFSWSDRLADNTDKDPIYAELSILFLLTLSSVPLLAESLAIDGVLASVASSAIVGHYRRQNGIGPFVEPTRMFSVWYKGLLPLTLNILASVGAPVAAEVAAFLNGFPEQLKRASDALDKGRAPSVVKPTDGVVTLGIAAEAHSLAVISFILEQVRSAGAAAGIIASEVPELAWDGAGVKEDIEGWLSGRRSLRQRIMPANERDITLSRTKANDGESENALEEKIVWDLNGAAECLGNDSMRS